MVVAHGSERYDLPDSLFVLDEEPAPKPKPPPPPESGPSLGMRQLLAEQTAKAERRKARSKTVPASAFERMLTEVDEMIRSAEWTGARPGHLVALYWRMHEKCYGVTPAELGAAERHRAVLLAGGFVKREFAGAIVEAVEYMRWAWTREIGREKWRRENTKTGGRIGVRLMFGGGLLTDYRVDLVRQQNDREERAARRAKRERGD